MSSLLIGNSELDINYWLLF